jgi:hypothetical protein
MGSLVHPLIRSAALILLLSARLGLAADVVVPDAPESAKPHILQVSYSDKLLSVTAQDADVQDVFKAISEKTGVQVEVFAGVTGAVTMTLEKVPLEAAVDRLLGSVGQRNYLMAYQGDGLQKLAIVPTGGGGVSLSEEVKRVKVRGRLRSEDLTFQFGKLVDYKTGKELAGNERTGAEIEYFPGELIVTLGEYHAQDQGRIVELVKTLEEKHGLVLIRRTRLFDYSVLKFRILGDRDVLDVMYQLPWDIANIATPNGLGRLSIEFPNEDLNVAPKLTTEELRECYSRGLGPDRCRNEKMPFLRSEKLTEDAIFPTNWIEGLYGIAAGAKFGARNKTLRICNDEGCLPLVGGLFCANMRGTEAYWAKYEKLRKHGVIPSTWQSSYSGNYRPNDELYPW